MVTTAAGLTVVPSLALNLLLVSIFARSRELRSGTNVLISLQVIASLFSTLFVQVPFCIINILQLLDPKNTQKAWFCVIIDFFPLRWTHGMQFFVLGNVRDRLGKISSNLSRNPPTKTTTDPPIAFFYRYGMLLEHYHLHSLFVQKHPPICLCGICVRYLRFHDLHLHQN